MSSLIHSLVFPMKIGLPEESGIKTIETGIIYLGPNIEGNRGP